MISGSSRMLSPAEVADFLGVARSFVYRELLDTGLLVSVKIGRKARRIPSDALDAYLARLQSEQAERQAAS